jgi:hypothetical protein
MYGADRLVGTWQYNVAKSKSTGANPVMSQTDVREATPNGGSTLTRTGQLKDGTAVNYSFTFKYDGKEYPVTGGPYDSVSVKQANANTTTYEIRKAGGKYHMMGKQVVSKDGRTLTQTSKGTDSSGNPVTSTSVFDKQ